MHVLSNRYFFTVPEIRHQSVAGLVSVEASLSGLQMAVFSLHPHMAFPLCTCREGRERERDGAISGVSYPFYKDISPSGLKLLPYDLI